MLLPTSTLKEALYSSASRLLLVAVCCVWGRLLLVKFMVEGVFLMKFISLEVGVRIVWTPAGMEASSLRVRASLSTSWIIFWWKDDRWLIWFP
jgi:hypothetical protein